MDYQEATTELLKKLSILARSTPHKQVGEFMGGEMFILNFLYHKQQAFLPSELSAVMNISSARIAAILNSLEKKGMVWREIDEADRRKILVTITDQGKAFAFEKHQHMYDSAARLLRELGEHDVKESMRILDRVIEIYRRKIVDQQCSSNIS